MGKRLIIQLPSHPMFMLLFIFLALTPLIWLYLIPRALALAFQPLGLSLSVGYAIALAMVLLSMMFSVVNIAVMEIPRQVTMPEIEIEYVSIFGIPYPIPRIRLVGSKTIIAVNVGGAVIPLVISILILVLMSMNFKALPALLVALTVTVLVALVSHAFSRVVPGVGIVVPALIPPLAATISSIALSSLAGIMELAPAIAYAGAVIGTLIGADIVNLVKHFDKLQSPLVSIGGAGTFDGIYLSGIMALFLALLFT